VSKKRPLPQPQALHVVITHASHRYMLCWLCAAFAMCCVCYVLRCDCYMLCLLCWLCLLCDSSLYIYCVLRLYIPCCYIYCACCVLRLYIYTVRNSSPYAMLLYILCLLCAVLAVRFVSIYILCAIRHYMSPAHAIPTEILQRCKEKAVCAAKSDRNFTAV